MNWIRILTPIRLSPSIVFVDFLDGCQRVCANFKYLALVAIFSSTAATAKIVKIELPKRTVPLCDSLLFEQHKVLILGDNVEQISRHFISLSDAGYEIYVTSKAGDVATFIGKNQIDIVLINTHMATENGFEVAKTIRSIPRTAEMPIMMTSDDPSQVVAAFQAGGNDFISADVSTPELLIRFKIQIQAAQQRLSLHQTIDGTGRPTILLDDKSRVSWRTPHAIVLIEKYFKGSPISRGLPLEVREWAERKSSQPLITQGVDDLQLVMHLERDVAGNKTFIRLSEHFDVKKQLQRVFNLTPAEARVLYWVAKGKTNPEIGGIVGSAGDTVKKHMERICNKLGVENRNAAAAKALLHVPDLNKN